MRVQATIPVVLLASLSVCFGLSDRLEAKVSRPSPRRQVGRSASPAPAGSALPRKPSRVAGEGCGPRWSPTGKLVAFYVGEYWRGSEVRIAHREGKVLHKIPGACYPVWSPGGDHKVYYVEHHKTGSALCAYDLPSESSWPLYHSEDRAILFPSVSPDGKKIAFFLEGPRKKQCDIAVFFVDQSETKTYLGEAADLAMAPPKWSPDGQSIVFSVHCASYLLDVAEGSLASLIGSTSGEWMNCFEAAEWRPKAGALLLQGLAMTGDAGEQPERLYLLPSPAQSADPNAGDEGRFPVLVGNGISPCWAPDGRRFAFHRNGAIHIARLAEEHLTARGKDLVRGPLPYFNPKALPRAKPLVACDMQASSRYDVGRMEWSPDGSALVYVAREGIFIAPVPDGEPAPSGKTTGGPEPHRR